MPEEYLIRHCAPTLAGLKTGSTFLYPYASEEVLRSELRSLNRRMAPKGLRVLPLRLNGSKALCYAFRPGKLSRDLSDEDAAELLQRCGYDCGSYGKCLAQLARRLRSNGEFPHEIGLFLGYPPEDVKGFLEQGPCGHKCAGCWKVYGDEAAAQKRFEQYHKCARIYLEQWSNGRPLDRLTVASA